MITVPVLQGVLGGGQGSDRSTAAADLPQRHLDVSSSGHYAGRSRNTVDGARCGPFQLDLTAHFNRRLAWWPNWASLPVFDTRVRSDINEHAAICGRNCRPRKKADLKRKHCLNSLIFNFFLFLSEATGRACRAGPI